MNASSAALDDTYRIDRLTTEFYHPETEEAFRDYIRPRWVHDTRNAILLAAVFYLMFSVTDFLVMGYGEDYVWVLLNRLLVCAVGLSAAFFANRLWRQMVNGVVPSLVVGIAMVAFVVKTMYVPHDFGTHGMGMMAMLLGTYVFIPNRFMARLAICGPASVAFLIAMMGHYGMQAGQLATMFTLLMVTNVLGTMVAWRTSLTMREAFCDSAVLKAANLRLEREAEERRRLEESLRKRADHDETTGLANRATLFDVANGMMMEARLSRQPLTLILLDVDYFKQLNGTYGHMCGDDILRTLTMTSGAVLPPGHFMARLGGEEFVILLPGSPVAEAARVAERIRAECARAPVDFAELTVHFTLSAGVAQWLPGESINVLLRRADQAVSAAKYKGRNRVEIAA